MRAVRERWRAMRRRAAMAFTRHPLAILWTATLATLVVSWRWRAQCLGFAWQGRQYEQRCYNDVQPLYHTRGLADGQMPYVEAFSEYPVVTGMFQYAAARLTDDVSGFYAVTALLLGTVALAVTWILVADRGPRPRLLLWAVGPPLFLYAFHNWDLLAVGLSTAAFLLYRRGHVAATGAVMALAGMAKVYPLLFLPLLGIDLLRRERGLGPQGWRFGLAAVGTLVVVNMPFWIADAGLWWQTYTFHTGRSPNFESIWWVLRLSAEATGTDVLMPLVSGSWVDRIMVIAIAGGLIGFGAGIARGGDVRIACLGMLLAFLLPSKVFSVQYALWILPFLVLVDVPRGRVLAFLVGDALVFWTVWPLMLGTPDSPVPFAIAVVLRFMAMAWLLAWAVRVTGARTPTPVEQETGPPGSPARGDPASGSHASVSQPASSKVHREA